MKILGKSLSFVLRLLYCYQNLALSQPTTTCWVEKGFLSKIEVCSVWQVSGAVEREWRDPIKISILRQSAFSNSALKRVPNLEYGLKNLFTAFWSKIAPKYLESWSFEQYNLQARCLLLVKLINISAKQLRHYCLVIA